MLYGQRTPVPAKTLILYYDSYANLVRGVIRKSVPASCLIRADNADEWRRPRMKH
jgi:hypothetical protein